LKRWIHESEKIAISGSQNVENLLTRILLQIGKNEYCSLQNAENDMSDTCHLNSGLLKWAKFAFLGYQNGEN